MDSTVNAISDPLKNYWESFVNFLPQLVGALIVLIIGLIVASIIGSIVKKLLQLGEENKHTQRFLERWNINLRLSKFIGKFVWWIVFLVFLSAAVQVLDVQALTETINNLVAYLPALFAALIVAVITFIGAKVVKGLVVDALNGINFSTTKVVANTAYVVVLVFGLTLAATQLGLDMSLFTANISIIVAGVMLALGLAFGLGGKDAASRAIQKMHDEPVVRKVAAPQTKKRR